MYEWQRQIQVIVDEIDDCIQTQQEEALTLSSLANIMGYSSYHMTRKFKEITGIKFRDYLRQRRLAFALKEVRDGTESMLEIALRYGFSSQEAFTRAFLSAFGTTPGKYRKYPSPVVLRTKLTPFDRYFLGLDEIGDVYSKEGVKGYFVHIPKHKFLCIINKESNGYWDFWQKQNLLLGQDQDTICGLLDSVKGKLDDLGGHEINGSSGQIMAYINDPGGRLCDWGYLRSECWGVRLPFSYEKEIPKNMYLLDIPEAEYIVFEHGPFDYEQENRNVEKKIEEAMASFRYEDTSYELDDAIGRIMYFYFDPSRYFKYVRPVKKRRDEVS